MKLEQLPNLLPETVRLIAGMIGLPNTLKLVENLGGTTFPVSKKRSRLGEARYLALAEVVGVEAADRLCQHYGGDLLYIPRCASALRRLRDYAICEAFDRLSRELGSNAAVSQLAQQHRLTDRRIWDILKRTDCSDPAATDPRRH
ncbi:DNA transposition protein [Chromobacterium subtsugae]|uniref:DNA transposition protein n=1 Tax=Chromobacterium subtsugae TaxID=251747 RepID=A0ABS7FM36_9NEIS|nr:MULTISPECIES: Mor transcription activator family protein [Chromobacterium]KUM02921.1 DNA transposition protein [Chromobacterium subtsugae]KZE84136.1 DNA transposition protein [Chromobacterium sp. F49]MBW7568660.1 DNA transposition protein [Chromobacterium subtsugae]MBW8290334.1 DNA transposition protein [Chromobacterium subtsugae]OBU86005.1 DNA transposition protein [Chromobacterium subtsugae]